MKSVNMMPWSLAWTLPHTCHFNQLIGTTISTSQLNSTVVEINCTDWSGRRAPGSINRHAAPMNMHELPVCHTYIHARRQSQTRWSRQSAVTGLSPVGYHCPVPPDPLSASPSGWGPGSVATGPWGSSAHRLASHSGAAHRLDHWAAGTGPWGWLLPWGDARGRMTRRQTGRDDAMSRISNSLTGTASDSRTGENEFADLLARSSSFTRCELGRSGTPACTGSVWWFVGL